MDKELNPQIKFPDVNIVPTIDEDIYQGIKMREERKGEFEQALQTAKEAFEGITDEGERHDHIVYMDKLKAGLREVEEQLEEWRSYKKPPEKLN